MQAAEPIIHGAEIKKGVYVARLGNNEVDEELILRADKVVIDDWETDKHRMGDTMAYMFRDGKIDDSRIDASVSDLVAGRKSGRDNDDQLTYTCNVGLGLYDALQLKDPDLFRRSLWNGSYPPGKNAQKYDPDALLGFRFRYPGQ